MIVNRKAYHDYEILETVEVGIVLRGAEVKSLREGTANLKGSYADIKDDEVWLLNFHISPYPQAGIFNPDPYRDKKLLLHRRQIRKLTDKIKEKGLTLIPLKVYFRNGKAKVQMALVRGKKMYDKRRVLKEKELKREQER
ncbi:MAG: SsrA-binding protein SmpB, partial [Desulfurellaceae bacterium]|nr:SsrA-binding protein SmpB [Desulfurellaceae bacterium]